MQQTNDRGVFRVEDICLKVAFKAVGFAKDCCLRLDAQRTCLAGLEHILWCGRLAQAECPSEADILPSSADCLLDRKVDAHPVEEWWLTNAF